MMFPSEPGEGLNGPRAVDIAVNGEVVATSSLTADGELTEVTMLRPIRAPSRPWIEELMPFPEGSCWSC